MTSDLLNMAYINSLPQPFMLRLYGSADWWPVEDIDVGTGLTRMDVCGKLQILHIGDVAAFRDIDGALHEPDSFYANATPTEVATLARSREGQGQ
jgi:hypothetical protein